MLSVQLEQNDFIINPNLTFFYYLSKAIMNNKERKVTDES